MKYQDYDFELEKVFNFVGDADFVALQFPEGLMKFSIQISETIEANTKAHTIIFGDVVYGACNFDPCACELMGIQKYIHFGHSQLVNSKMDCLFVPCRLKLQITPEIVKLVQDHIDSIQAPLVQLTGTAQTYHLIPTLQAQLRTATRVKKFRSLGSGEILGCTCAREADVVYSLVDGIFHGEAALICGVSRVFQVNLLLGVIRELKTDVLEKKQQRVQMLKQINFEERKKILVVFGTLGQQSSLKTLMRVKNQLQKLGKEVQVQALQEIFPNKIIGGFDLVVQIACPRLTFDWSEDWGGVISLNELENMMDMEDTYKLDNFANEGKGYGDMVGGTL